MKLTSQKGNTIIKELLIGGTGQLGPNFLPSVIPLLRYAHNIRGTCRVTDQDNILQELKKQRIDILGLSETKVLSNAVTFSFKN